MTFGSGKRDYFCTICQESQKPGVITTIFRKGHFFSRGSKHCSKDKMHDPKKSKSRTPRHSVCSFQKARALFGGFGSQFPFLPSPRAVLGQGSHFRCFKLCNGTHPHIAHSPQVGLTTSPTSVQKLGEESPSPMSGSTSTVRFWTRERSAVFSASTPWVESCSATELA